MDIKRYECMGRMSRVVEHNGVLYLSGHAAPGTLKTVKEQTEYIVNKIDAVLKQYGSDREHILSAVIYLKDMSFFAEMNAVWDQWIGMDNGPARTCVSAFMSSEDMLVEITVTAAVK